MSTHQCVYTYIYMCVWIYIHIDICIYTCMRAHTHTHIAGMNSGDRQWCCSGSSGLSASMSLASLLVVCMLSSSSCVCNSAVVGAAREGGGGWEGSSWPVPRLHMLMPRLASSVSTFFGRPNGSFPKTMSAPVKLLISCTVENFNAFAVEYIRCHQ